MLYVGLGKFQEQLWILLNNNSNNTKNKDNRNKKWHIE